MGMDSRCYPKSMIELAEAIGDDVALALIRERSGSVVYVPVKARPGHWIAEIVGMEAADRLSRLYGGDTIDVPFCRSAENKLRDEKIVRELRSGRTIQEVASEFRLTRRMVQRVKVRIEHLRQEKQS